MIDLEKYNLGYLRTKPMAKWEEEEFDKLLSAMDSEDAAPVLDIPFTPENIERLLAVSNCRECGMCCRTNPRDDKTSGIMIEAAELESIAEATDQSLEELKSKLIKHEKDASAMCIPLPCMFCKDDKCEIYEVRPRVCRTYPLGGVTYDDESYTMVNLRCDYGKDIYKYLLRGY